MPREGAGTTDADPAAYPETATFGELLQWHLEWGTRPGCDRTTRGRNRPWTESEFAEFVHAGSAELNSAERNLRNWKNGKLPDDKKNKDRIERIFQELFGGDRKLAAWKADLERALERGRRHQAARIAKRDSAELVAAAPVPSPTAHFIGRDDERDALVRALVSGDSSTLLVQGGPGMGKTELTKAVAHEDAVAEHFGERRWFVPLETAATAAAARDVVIHTLGLDPALGFQPALDMLRGKRALLILDNLETPWEPGDQRSATERALAELASVPGVAILASFRGRDSVGGPGWLECPLEALSRSDAAALFASIAGSWVADDPQFHAFLDALGGVPLAIDLVARRAHGRASLAPLWREWLKVGADLAVHPDFEAGRLTSLPHSIELSLRAPRITGPALRLFSLLGALPAGLAGDDTEALMGVDAFDSVERLCHAGIAVELGDRLDLLPPIRDHALRYHGPKGADADLWPEHFLAVLGGLRKALGTTSGDEALNRLRPEFRNIEASLRAKLYRNQRLEAREAFDSFARAARWMPIPTTLLDEVAAICQSENDPLGAANYIKVIGDIALDRSEYDIAHRSYEKASALYRRAENRPEREANCIRMMGNVALYRTDYSAARAQFERALRLYRECGDGLGEANCVKGLANILLELSDHGGAQAAFEEARRLYQLVGDDLGRANCLKGRADIALRRSEYADAQADFAQALALYRTIGDRLGEANCTKRLGDIALYRSAHGEAGAAYEEARRLYGEMGNALGEADCVRGFGDIALVRSELAAAQIAYEEALPLYRRIDNRLGQAECAMKLGDVALGASNFDSAKSAYDSALAIFRDIGDSAGEALCDRRRAALEEARRLDPAR